MKHRLGGGGVQYISLVGYNLPPLDGCLFSFNNRSRCMSLHLLMITNELHVPFTHTLIEGGKLYK